MRYVALALLVLTIGCEGPVAEIDCQPDGGYHAVLKPGVRNMRITGSCSSTLAEALPPPPKEIVGTSDLAALELGVKNKDVVRQLTIHDLTQLHEAENREFEMMAGPVSETAEKGWSNWWSGLFGFLGGLLTSGVLL